MSISLSYKIKKDKSHFVCQNCGYSSLRWVGKCPECESWNTFIEETIVKPSANSIFATTEASKVIKLSEVSFADAPRIASHSNEFNRVLGGGIVRGSLVLIGGSPGIGKSTLMLQEGAYTAKKDFPVLYVSGEESYQQVKLRADRLGINSEHLFILAETDINRILDAFQKIKPQMVIVDSIQTIFQPAFESSPGSISQVRECALAFSKVAKSSNVPIFLIGHITKDGYIAGPKTLEHLVDVLLQFEGDREHFYRILRAVKNRFGSTREIGVFEMKQNGLQEVKNPSALFLEHRKENISGSSIVCIMEGTRPFLVEIQALATSTNFGMPQRTTTGVDAKRLSLLIAVLEKRIGLRLGGYDIFVNAVGGVKIDDTSADLGILTSITSSFRDEVVDANTVVIGEIGLGGEIRAVSQIESRLEEAAKLGFKKAIVPKINLKGIENKSLKLVGVEKANEALEEVMS